MGSTVAENQLTRILKALSVFSSCFSIHTGQVIEIAMKDSWRKLCESYADPETSPWPRACRLWTWSKKQRPFHQCEVANATFSGSAPMKIPWSRNGRRLEVWLMIISSRGSSCHISIDTSSILMQTREGSAER